MRDPSPLEVEAMREPKPKRPRDRVLASGLTGRQEAAMRALEGHCANSVMAEQTAERVAVWSVEQADALWDALEEA